MNLALDHDDIIEALGDFVQKKGIQVEGVTMDIQVSCGRGANATSATVTLIAADSLAAGPEKDVIVPPKKAPAKKATSKQGKTPELETEVLPQTSPDGEVESETPIESSEDKTEEVPASTGGLFDE